MYCKIYKYKYQIKRDDGTLLVMTAVATDEPTAERIVRESINSFGMSPSTYKLLSKEYYLTQISSNN